VIKKIRGSRPPFLFESRLANVEYHQSLITADFLKNISEVIQLTQPRKTNQPLRRIGNFGDGGYVIMPIAQSNLCLNLGVGLEVSADRDLLKQGFQIHAYDGSVDNPLPEENLYNFTQKNIGYSHDNSVIDLKEIFSLTPALQEVDLILIDIEGHEYKVLREEFEFVSKAKQIVVEFHGLELIADKNFATNFIKILKILSKNHAPIHIHGNNSGSTLPLGGASWPTILEVTFVRKDYTSEEINYGPFPGTLDYPNVGHRPDIDLSPFYGLHKSYASLARTILEID